MDYDVVCRNVYGCSFLDCTMEMGSVFTADKDNMCIFYWCNRGISLGPYDCALGSGVPANFMGNTNPCTVRVVGSCDRNGKLNVIID